MKQKNNSLKANRSGEEKMREFKIQLNEFGEVITNFEVDKINQFLNKNVEDKKLKDRDDL